MVLTYCGQNFLIPVMNCLIRISRKQKSLYSDTKWEKEYIARPANSGTDAFG